jgi:methylenetetrahydrofolate reductase (NADPH)
MEHRVLLASSRKFPAMTTEALQAATSLRYETLPFGALDRELDALDHPLILTVTCSPRHGNDHTVDVAEHLRERGHSVVVHLAARMVRSEAHLDTLLGRIRGAGISDIFLIGGDQEEPLGPFSRGLDLLPVLRNHTDAPGRIGVPGYPEGHPQITPEVLLADLRAKEPLADYVVTQLCFDVPALTDWLAEIRESGIALPIYAGLPGMVDRKRLLEVSMRVGVGPSISYLRKQHGLTHLAGRVHRTAERLYDEVSPLVDTAFGFAGIHFFTFNRLVETARFAELRAAKVRDTGVGRQRR